MSYYNTPSLPTSTVFCTKSEYFETEKYDNAVNCPQNPMRCGTLGSEKAKSKGVRRWGHCPRGNERLCSFEAYFIILKDPCQSRILYVSHFIFRNGREKRAPSKKFFRREFNSAAFSQKSGYILLIKLLFKKPRLRLFAQK